MKLDLVFGCSTPGKKSSKWMFKVNENLDGSNLDV